MREFAFASLGVENHVINAFKTFGDCESCSIDLAESASSVKIVMKASDTASLVRMKSVPVMALQAQRSVLRVCLDTVINSI